jgi:hypothetical protein
MRKTLEGAVSVVALLVATVAAGQGVPSGANSPADSSRSIQAQPATSSALAAVLNRSCGDCHSNAMQPGWYTRVPPFSTLMARGAKEGRKAVNFSEWTSYSPEQQRTLLLASCKDATLGKMPMKSYVRLRADAQLSAPDVETICSAARDLTSAPVVSATRQLPKEP